MLKKKNKMIRKIHGLILTIGLFIIVGCGDQMPDEVIPPAQMENILYDYHLSLGMSANLNYTDNYMKTSYMNYIYQKHNITLYDPPHICKLRIENGELRIIL